jgi:hypothetical protein
MADVQQNVLIAFTTDTSQLQPAVDKLADLGKIEKTTADAFKATNTEINKQEKALSAIGAINNQINQSGKVTKKNLDDVAKAVKEMGAGMQKEFKGGIIDALQQAGVEAKEFEGILDSSLGNTEQASVSLRTQLRAMIQQLAEMKVAGQDASQEYLDLAQKAGELKDAMADANQEVANFGSDTSTIDGVISAVSGLAGGFAVVQGAAALFGDESEELQKTLLRVNAAMAILQGLQQIQNVLQRESAAATLANTIATKAQTVAQAAMNFVIGSSTGLLKAFRIALATTGVGLLIIGIGKLISMFQSSNDELEEANQLLEQQKGLIDDLNASYERTTQVRLALLKKEGAAESESIRATGQELVKKRTALRESNRTLAEMRDQLKYGSEEWEALNKQIGDNTRVIEGLDTDIVVTAINLETQLANERKEALKERQDAAKKAAEDEKKRREEALQREKEARAAGFADFKAGVELELLAVEKGSEEELEIKKRLLRAELQIELDNEKLTANQRKLLAQTFFKERLELDKEYAKNRQLVQLQNIQADLQADLQALEISNEQKLELTESLINLTAEMEITAAEGNASKIELINANRDKAIREARIASIRETTEYEISLAESVNGAYIRGLRQLVSDNKKSVEERMAAIQGLAEFESGNIQKRINALNEERNKGLISQKDYNLQYAQLVDQQAQVWENAEKSKTDVTVEEEEKRREANRKTVETILQTAATVADVLGSLYDLQAEKENQRLEEQRQKLKDLQEAGAITEKEALARSKRLDAEERKLKQQQAQRDKQIAVFKALIAIPQAYLEGLSQGGPILGAIYAAIAGVQAAMVIARPIPKFGKGKKNSYEGPAEVGETGAELIEKDGKMYLADKPQIIWLGKRDKVFNPQETIQMLSVPQMNTEREGGNTTIKVPEINYEKLGEAVGKHVQTYVYVDGVKEQSIKKQQFEQYLDARRSF